VVVVVVVAAVVFEQLKRYTGVNPRMSLDSVDMKAI
jgi:hypothetical protein